MTAIGRRAFLCTGASAIAAASGAAADSLPRFAGATLKVATWGGTWRDKLMELVGKRLEERGATVEFVVGTPQTHLARVIAARGQATPPFDVVEISDNDRSQWTRAGFFAPIDYGNVPNAAESEPRFKLDTLVATSLTEDGIVWNPDRFRAADIPEPKTYADLLNPKLKGYVAFPDISGVQGVKAIVGISHELGGSEADIGPALAFVKQLDAQLYWRSAVDLLTKFQAGDIWAAPWQVGGVVKGRQAGLPLTVAWPKLGDKVGVISAVWVGIVRGTANRRAAEYFVNEYRSEQAQFGFAEFNGVVPASPAATTRLATLPMQRDAMRLSPEQLAQFYYPDFGSLPIVEWMSRWNAQILQ